MVSPATSSTPPPSSTPSLDELRAVAGSVCDPELPPLTLADLGILRDVQRTDDAVVVTLSPTYSGCPAIEFIEDEVRRALEAAGCTSVRIERAFQPSWTTDWITDDGRRKLTEAGIAPPRQTGSTAEGTVPVTLGRRPDRQVVCPRCGATTTTEISPFGSTACKALFRCDGCSEPFDYFKEI
ncbi:MAG: 1,2-phenylacetyl-CoA epoxidase subunit PaaD [Acidimicrobiales bacterium]